MRWLAAGLFVAMVPGALAAGELRIACTTFPVAVFTRAVAGDLLGNGVSVTLVVPAATGCPHDYEPTAADLRRLAAADAVVISGLGLDQFAIDALPRVNPKARVIDASEGVNPIANHDAEERRGPGGRGDHDHGAWNPHWFASPAEAARAARHIARALGDLAPDWAPLFADNAGAFAVEAEALIPADGDGFAGMKVAVLHDAFGYYARDYGLVVAAVLEIVPGVEPSMAEMRRIVERIEKENVRVVLAEMQYDTGLARAVAIQTGVPWVRMQSMASGPDDAGGDYFLAAMRENRRLLEGARRVEQPAE
jgi:zinc/manganese transport system substrate-binding protein/zinc transport system substrate-binding protein